MRMVQKRKKRPVVRDIKSDVKVVETKSAPHDLESDVEQLESQRESSFVSRPSSTPTLRQTAPLQPKTEPREVQPRIREVEEARPYTSPSDAQIYTAISAQNNVSRYTMHSQAKADARVGMHSRTPVSPPSLEPRSFNPSQNQVISRPSLNEPNSLRSPWQEQDRRYDLYREDSLQNANRTKSRRR